MGSTLVASVPFNDWFYHDLTVVLMHSKLTGGSILAYLSTVGTFADMLDHSRPT